MRSTKSWEKIALEIEQATGHHYNRAMIYQVAMNQRKPTVAIVIDINKTYHRYFEFPQIRIETAPLKCGHMPTVSRRCKICHPSKSNGTPRMSYKALSLWLMAAWIARRDDSTS